MSAYPECITKFIFSHSEILYPLEIYSKGYIYIYTLDKVCLYFRNYDRAALWLWSPREQNKAMQLCVSCEKTHVKQRVLDFEITPEKVPHAISINCLFVCFKCTKSKGLPN